ncbi:MAG: hypothetical protein M1825_001917 [Sarcosagium campestre]|nr:MAG: hypothetical protein M1825_001917 [Sarcosagium campestre]
MASSPHSPSPRAPPSSSPSPSPPPTAVLPLSTSVHLSSLPTPATTALAIASTNPQPNVPEKVTIRLRPLASTPTLARLVFKVGSDKNFGALMAFVAKKLGKDGGSADVNTGGRRAVWGYVNSVFAPGWDEGIGGLWACFKVDDQLVVGYSVTPAFG